MRTQNDKDTIVMPQNKRKLYLLLAFIMKFYPKSYFLIILILGYLKKYIIDSQVCFFNLVQEVQYIVGQRHAKPSLWFWLINFKRIWRGRCLKVLKINALQDLDKNNNKNV
jgi:hypothetical protein